MAWGIVRVLLLGLLAGGALARRINDSSSEEDESLPKDFPLCHYSSANASACVREAAEHARAWLARGLPALGVQPLEPLRVPSVRLRQHTAPKNGFKYDAWLSDVMIKGLTDYTLNKLDVFPDELRVAGNVSLPHLFLSADLVLLGHFQMLPVEAVGKLVANMTMCTAAVEGQAARVHQRTVVRDSGVKLQCRGPLAADLQDSDTGADHMAMIADHIVEMHSNDIVCEVKPAVETALAMVLEDIANKFLRHVPHDMVFPM